MVLFWTKIWIILTNLQISPFCFITIRKRFFGGHKLWNTHNTVYMHKINLENVYIWPWILKITICYLVDLNKMWTFLRFNTFAFTFDVLSSYSPKLHDLFCHRTAVTTILDLKYVRNVSVSSSKMFRSCTMCCYNCHCSECRNQWC